MIDFKKASEKLSELDIKFTIENLDIEVLWFRVMIPHEEWVINRHTHSSYEFHFIYSGSCRVVLDNREFIAHSNDFYLTRPGIFHRQESIPGNKMVEFCINCDLKLKNSNETEAAYLYHTLKDAECRPIKDKCSIPLFCNALSEALIRNTGFCNSIKSNIILILTESARLLGACQEAHFVVPVKRKKNEYRMRQIEKFIDDNIESQICAEDIAKIMYLSTKQVGRIIVQTNGMNAKEFIMHKKLDKAKQLLRSSDLSVKEISNKLGFSSEYYFSQFFKKNEGYSPTMFRENVNHVQ